MKDQIKQVADRITFASMNYRIWRIYSVPGDRAKYLGVLQRYNSFFLTSLQAHFVAAIITLYCLYEIRRESISPHSSSAGIIRPKTGFGTSAGA